MRKCMYMLYPEGKHKALTLSYDDGVVQDVRLIRILDQYGIKATFNLNSRRLNPEEPSEVPTWGVLSQPAALRLYRNTVHEVAVHSLTHPFLEKIPLPLVYTEILEDRKNLEAMFGGIIRGMAYPQGTYNDEVVRSLRECGIAYARTTEFTEDFNIPCDWLRLKATCHHNNPNLFTLADRFMNEQPFLQPWLFYLWGHSYEFDTDNNWDRIERFCETVGKREDIWYATNIEVYDYVQAWQRLEYSAAANRVYNPSIVPVWFMHNEEIICIDAGETKDF